MTNQIPRSMVGKASVSISQPKYWLTLRKPDKWVLLASAILILPDAHPRNWVPLEEFLQSKQASCRLH